MCASLENLMENTNQNEFHEFYSFCSIQKKTHCKILKCYFSRCLCIHSSESNRMDNKKNSTAQSNEQFERREREKKHSWRRKPLRMECAYIHIFCIEHSWSVSIEYFIHWISTIFFSRFALYKSGNSESIEIIETVPIVTWSFTVAKATHQMIRVLFLLLLLLLLLPSKRKEFQWIWPFNTIRSKTINSCALARVMCM